MKRRGELIERSFAHCYETGGMRRTHLRGHRNILKRLLVHVAGFNLGLVMRMAFGIGKPRRLQDGLGGLLADILCDIRSAWHRLTSLWRSEFAFCATPATIAARSQPHRAA